MEELADRIRPGRFKLVDDAADPFIGFLILLAVRENVADAGNVRGVEFLVAHARMALKMISPERFVNVLKKHGA